MEKRSGGSSSWQEVDVRKGPWTMEEDFILINYIANHGEGVWNSVAKSAGLKRTGKSCRLRWLNYLRPDVRRGNITPEEQLLIMELHAKWGNRWSKIAKLLPGRTDNEIKNFWRTKIQKHIKQIEKPSLNNYQSFEATEPASSSQVFGSSDTVETYSPKPMTAAFYQVSTEIDNYPVVASPYAFPVDHSNENYWNVEDLWSMQLLNGD